MLNTLFLLGLAATLVIYLLARRVPRKLLFEVLQASAWLYTGAFFLSSGVIDNYWPNLTDGLVPYLPPIIPVVVFLAIFLPKMTATSPKHTPEH